MYTKPAMTNEELIDEIVKKCNELKNSHVNLSVIKIRCPKQESFDELLKDYNKTVNDLKNINANLSRIFITLKL